MEDDIFAAREEDVAEFNKRRRKNDKRFGAAPSVPSEEELAAQEAEAQARYHAALQQAVVEGKAPPELLSGAGAQPGKKDFRGRYYYEKLKVQRHLIPRRCCSRDITSHPHPPSPSPVCLWHR